MNKYKITVYFNASNDLSKHRGNTTPEVNVHITRFRLQTHDGDPKAFNREVNESPIIMVYAKHENRVLHVIINDMATPSSHHENNYKHTINVTIIL